MNWKVALQRRIKKDQFAQAYSPRVTIKPGAIRVGARFRFTIPVTKKAK